MKITLIVTFVWLTALTGSKLTLLLDVMPTVEHFLIDSIVSNDRNLYSNKLRSRKVL
jgi:hypothetical protein